MVEHDLDGMAALVAAGATWLCKRKGERDTEFVKRIVCAYLNAKEEIDNGTLVLGVRAHRAKRGSE